MEAVVCCRVIKTMEAFTHPTELEAMGLGFTEVVAFGVTQGVLSMISTSRLCYFPHRKDLLAWH